MLKRDFPIYFNNIEIEIPHLAWQIGYANIIVINETEAGTDDVEYTRFGKTTIRAQFRCMDEWTSFFVSCNSLPGFDVRYYDIEEKQYVTKTMRMDGLSISERRYTDELEITNGVYDISFNLVEF